METTLRVVACPCCKQMLYALELQKKVASTTWMMSKDSPAIQHDAEGYFVKCKACSKRIEIEMAVAPGKTQWVVSSKQKCDRVLP